MWVFSCFILRNSSTWWKCAFPLTNTTSVYQHDNKARYVTVKRSGLGQPPPLTHGSSEWEPTSETGGAWLILAFDYHLVSIVSFFNLDSPSLIYCRFVKHNRSVSHNTAYEIGQVTPQWPGRTVSTRSADIDRQTEEGVIAQKRLMGNFWRRERCVAWAPTGSWGGGFGLHCWWDLHRFIDSAHSIYMWPLTKSYNSSHNCVSQLPEKWENHTSFPAHGTRWLLGPWLLVRSAFIIISPHLRHKLHHIPNSWTV